MKKSITMLNTRVKTISNGNSLSYNYIVKLIIGKLIGLICIKKKSSLFRYHLKSSEEYEYAEVFLS